MKHYLSVTLSAACRVFVIAVLVAVLNPVAYAASQDELLKKRRALLDARYEGKNLVERMLASKPKAAKPAASKQQAAKPYSTESGDMLYGFLFSDESEDYVPGIVSITMDELATTTLLHESELHVMGGTCVVNELYLQTYSMATLAPTGLWAKNVDTGEERLVCEYGEDDPMFFDMTYDASTETMYAVGGGLLDYAMSIYSVSPTDGSYEQLFPLDYMFLTLASDDNGSLYGIDETGYFYHISPDEQTCETVDWTGMLPAYTQSMAYNSNDGLIYWACYEDDATSSLVKINPEYCAAEIVAETLGYNAEIGALFFLNDPTAALVPSAPMDFDVMAGGSGANNATLMWGNPSTSLDGNPLASLDRIDIYRNGEVVHQVEDPVPGNFMTWKDNDVPTGMTTYQVVGVNEYGNGKPAERSIFIGRDAPGQVRNLTAAKDEDSYVVRLSWQAPIVGKHGGYMDASTMRYNVVRYPDEKVMAEGITECAYVDETITETTVYTYGIVAINDDGEGDELRSNPVVSGPALEIPFSCTFDTQEERDMWVIVDNNNDGCTWYFNSNWGGDSRYYMHYESDDITYTASADDWFFSAPIHFEAGKQYLLTYEVRLGGQLGSESFKVALCSGQSPDQVVQVIDNHDKDFDSNFLYEDAAAAFIPTETGDYSLGFCCYSDPAYFVHITNINVTEVSKVDAACTNLRGFDVAVQGEATSYELVVSNTGATVLTDFLVQVVDDADNVYGEVNVSNYELDLYSYVVVPVTCNIETSAISVPLKGRVVLEGDENGDNDLSAAIDVEVIQDSEKYDMLLVGNDRSQQYCAYLPFDYHLKYSVGQILYTPEMLGFESSIIERMGYQYYVQQGEYAKDIKTQIYMANIDDVDQILNWIDPERFTLVYDGTVSLDETNNASMITLDEPFAYNGGNLCIMTKTDGGCEDYFYNFFKASKTDGTMCSMTWSGDEMTFDPSVMGMETPNYPNITFVLDTDYSSVGNVAEAGYTVRTLADRYIEIAGSYDRAWLYSIDGMLLKVCDGESRVAVGDCSDGIYILKVEGNGMASSHKVIVKH